METIARFSSGERFSTVTQRGEQFDVAVSLGNEYFELNGYDNIGEAMESAFYYAFKFEELDLSVYY